VPLDALSAELEAHLATLKQRLVEVINEDYADFVSLSGKLVNVDGAVLRMHRPLLEVKARPPRPAARPGLGWGRRGARGTPSHPGRCPGRACPDLPSRPRPGFSRRALRVARAGRVCAWQL